MRVPVCRVPRIGVRSKGEVGALPSSGVGCSCLAGEVYGILRKPGKLTLWIARLPRKTCILALAPA